MNYEYECAISGVTEEGGPFVEESDGLGDLPPGWTRVTLARRVYNPRWIILQQVKEASLAQLLAQVPEQLRDGQIGALQVQIDVQFYAMEKDTSIYLTEEEIVYLSDSGDIVDSLNEWRELIGLAPVEAPEDPTLGEDENEDEEGEGTPLPALESVAEEAGEESEEATPAG